MPSVEWGLAADLEPPQLDDDLLPATSATTLRLDGEVARLMRDRLLPLLTAGTTRDAVRTSTTDLPSDEVERVLTRLLETGVVVPVGLVAAPACASLVTSSRGDQEAVARRAGTNRDGRPSTATATGRPGRCCPPCAARPAATGPDLNVNPIHHRSYHSSYRGEGHAA